MKVLLFNGSPHANGNTAAALTQVAQVLQAQGLDTKIIHLGNTPLADCTACGWCQQHGQCVYQDAVNDWLAQAKDADGFIFGTPVYYAHPTGRLLSAMDRLFYAGKANFTHKPAAVITVARRAGTTSTIDVVLKHLMFAQMPVVSSTYWPQSFGADDAEGAQTLTNLANNFAWLLKSLEHAKKNGIMPPKNRQDVRTNFSH